MKKLMTIVNVELLPNGDYGLRFVDYRPPTEPVDPAKEFERKLKQNLPPEMSGFAGVIGNFVPPQLLTQQTYVHSASIMLTRKDYDEMGRPTAGDNISIELNVEKP